MLLIIFRHQRVRGLVRKSTTDTACETVITANAPFCLQECAKTDTGERIWRTAKRRQRQHNAGTTEYV